LVQEEVEHFKMPISSTLGILGSNLFGTMAAREANKASVEAQNRAIDTAKEMQEKGLSAMQVESPFGTRTRAPGGGFRMEVPGGPQSAAARTRGAETDIERRRMQAENLAYTPTISQDRATQMVAKEDADLGELAQRGFGDIVTARTRAGQGTQLPGSRFEGETAKMIGEWAQQAGLGGPARASELYMKGREADIAAYDALQQALEPKVPAPAFATDDPSGIATNLIAQTPYPGPPIDLTSAITPTLGRNVFADLYNAQDEAQRRKDYLEYANRIRAEVND
jgi:hypothetical protein